VALGATLVDELVRCGVTHACLAPGSRSAPLALALANHPGIDLHVGIDERSVAFMALGIAKATGDPVIVLSTSGTAGANFHPAVLEAHHSRTPLLVLTADRPPELRDTGANQTIDQIKMFGDAVRWFVEVGVPDAQPSAAAYWRSLAARAAYVTKRGPAGPVHLNIALREPLVAGPGEEISPAGGKDEGPWTRYVSSAPRLEAAQMDALIAELRAARRGVVVAGPGPADGSAVSRIAELLSWPLLADPLSDARFGTTAVSAYDALLRSPGFVRKHQPDVVLRFGALGISKSLAAHVAAADQQLLVDRDGAFLDADRSVDQVILCDAPDLAAALAASPAEPDSGQAWLASWLEADETAQAAIDTVLDKEASFEEPPLTRELVRSLPGNSSLVVAASMPFRNVEWFTQPRPDVRFFGNRGVNGIDGFVSTAMGIAIARQQPTFALCGDLSLLHDQNGLLLHEPHEVDLTFVVVNNDGGGIFSFLPQARLTDHFEELFGTPHGLDLAALAGLHRCDYNLVTTKEELRTVLTERGRGIRVAEVRTDRPSSVALHQRLQEAVQQALSL
jgi:2-succinyl-5-enolpyruvyl-6-hydroxy-3-cyclohexene-1-carboxylate synthase